MSRGEGWLGWEEAWRQALFGEQGFYRRPEGPAGHFRTAAHAAPTLLARAVARLAQTAGCSGVLDLGAGRGELLSALARLDEGARLRLHGVDVVDRPALLPPLVGWTRADRGVPYAAFDGALVVAWELLDTVPCPVLEIDDEGRLRTVLVEPVPGASGWGPRPRRRTSTGARAGGRRPSWIPVRGSRSAAAATTGGPVTSRCWGASAGACCWPSTTGTRWRTGRRSAP